jgi:DNA-nicking Smr family endonuclease
VAKQKPFNNPFEQVGRSLKKEIAAKAKAEKKAELEKALAPKAKKPAAPELDDKAMFLDAVAGITPRGRDQRGQPARALPPASAEHLQIHDEDAEVMAQLASLIDGDGTFDIADTDEYIEGAIEGLDKRILKKLRNGEFALHDEHLDLHGLTRDPARQSVEEFIQRTRTKGARCVLIVHGRGLNSKDNIPVLKEQLKSWLARGRIARHILAFATARPHDGGAGAVYVLLRR